MEKFEVLYLAYIGAMSLSMGIALNAFEGTFELWICMAWLTLTAASRTILVFVDVHQHPEVISHVTRLHLHSTVCANWIAALLLGCRATRGFALIALTDWLVAVTFISHCNC